MSAAIKAGIKSETKIHNYFKTLISGLLKLPAKKLQTNAPLERYGMDSVMVMRITDQLENDFGPLPKTLFFEYQTIAELAAYFVENHSDALFTAAGISQDIHREDSPQAATASATGTAPNVSSVAQVNSASTGQNSGQNSDQNSDQNSGQADPSRRTRHSRKTTSPL